VKMEPSGHRFRGLTWQDGDKMPLVPRAPETLRTTRESRTERQTCGSLEASLSIPWITCPLAMFPPRSTILARTCKKPVYQQHPGNSHRTSPVFPPAAPDQRPVVDRGRYSGDPQLAHAPPSPLSLFKILLWMLRGQPVSAQPVSARRA
jgi:hypothetical protein